MTFLRSITGLAALAAGLAATAATAQQQPTGVWIDHTGRGAVEIAECGGGLCGHIVWVKDAKHRQTCRTQVIGNVRSVGGGTWDRGWILDPDDNARYSVELKPIGQDRLRVVGYMGSKLFSETMTWRRAPADLQRCDGKQQEASPAAAPALPAAPPPVAQPEVAPSVVHTPPLALPERQATVPAPLPPVAAPAPAQPSVATPAPVAAPDVQTAETEPPRRGQRQANSKRKGSRECTLDLPYFTVKYSCDAF